ncbi:MAG: c-type cytochrome [Betaproteobacteria bacterium]
MMLSVIAVAALFVTPAQAGAQFPGVGRAATPAEIAAWDIDVRPDFKGLPAGSGSVADGQKVWDAKCASCHGTFGESNEVFTPIVGGTTAADIRTGRVKALTNPELPRTTLMKLSTISTLWDYVRRAMPWNAPKTLAVDEVYAVVAYILNLGDIVPDGFVLSDRNIAEVQARLPNRDGMTREHALWSVKAKPDVANVACMHDCAANVKVVSALPEAARAAHGNLAEQVRLVGPVRGLDTAPKTALAAAGAARPVKADASELARQKACLSCHGLDNRVVGPAFRDVAQRYKGQDGAQAQLLEKLRRGGSGAWGGVPMPPNPDLPDEEAKALLAWILNGAT